MTALLAHRMCTAQTNNLSTKNKKAIELYQQAESMLKGRERNFDGARDALYKAIEKDKNFIEAYEKLAFIHLTLKDFERAKNAYLKIAELQPDNPKYVNSYFTLALLYQKESDWANAKKYFDLTTKHNPADKKIAEEAIRASKCCTFAMQSIQNPLQFSPRKMSSKINNFFLQAYPFLTGDQQTLIFYVIRTADKKERGDIMISNFENGEWTLPVSISDKINTPMDEGIATLSADGRMLVFASCERPDGLGSCDLYVSYKEGNSWTEPQNMGSNINSPNWDSEPSLSADGKTLYFTSERKGGQGGLDIWYSQLAENGTWTKAKNIGPIINTKGDEASPFIHASGKILYFASKYHIGMGGYDLFFSTKNDTSWSEPKNLGYPINTAKDESTIYITPDFKKGYYAISEDSKGMRVQPTYLYEFDVPDQLKQPYASTYSKGTIYDAVSKAKVRARIELIDLATRQTIQSVQSDNVTGEYLLVLTKGTEYALYVSAEGYLFKSIFFDYKNPSSFNPLTLDVYLEPLKKGASIVLNNIFFQTNSWTLEEKSKTELDKLVVFLKQNESLSIEIAGHTDDVGNEADNLTLSDKRAFAVYEYLIRNGVNKKQIQYKGYGESKPAVPNTSEENRAKNRRIEFKIL
ncbi:MAG: OmpA family protein [Cytophagaceae bacterium]|nr:OmpA family protein [Cytophagaceae bacterium]MDW8455957.1 OmpA family protein [Cytophagaceae bacterium]